MNVHSALEKHMATCDAVFRIISEENRLLKVEQKLPGPALLEEKKSLLERLDEGLAALKEWDAGNVPSPDAQLVERLRSRILQILHLDRENEQLLLRYSLSGTTARNRPLPASARQLKGVYKS